MDKTAIICADVIAVHEQKFVLVERVEQSDGLALPGGKQDRGEYLSDTAVREMYEETGMHVNIYSVLGTYAEEDRDPRGRFVSTVFVGNASGTLCDEKGKTRVVLLTQDEILARKNDFLFDHFEILTEYFALLRKSPGGLCNGNTGC